MHHLHTINRHLAQQKLNKTVLEKSRMRGHEHAVGPKFGSSFTKILIPERYETDSMPRHRARAADEAIK